MSKERLNIVLMNLTVANSVSGVNRYMEILQRNLKEIVYITVHTVTLIEDKNMFFRQICKAGNSIEAVLPLPVNPYLIIKEEYWMNRYTEIIADIICPYFKGLRNLIWHTHCINLANLAVILKKSLGGKIITHLHCIPWKMNLENNIEKFNDLYYKFQKKEYGYLEDNFVETVAYRISDHIICVTFSGKDYLTMSRQIASSKISVVYNGIEDYTGDKIARNPLPTVPEILFVGQLNYSKGVKILLDALRKVYKAGYSFHAILAGGRSSRIMTMIKHHYNYLPLSVPGRLSFGELQKKYQSCTIGVLPSLHEQCSYAAIEMAMYGIPLIVTDVDGLREMFQHDETALKVPIHFDKTIGLEVDENVLAKTIVRLLSDRDLRERLSKNIREHYRNLFTARYMVSRTMEIYYNVIGNTNE